MLPVAHCARVRPSRSSGAVIRYERSTCCRKTASETNSAATACTTALRAAVSRTLFGRGGLQDENEELPLAVLRKQQDLELGRSRMRVEDVHRRDQAGADVERDDGDVPRLPLLERQPLLERVRDEVVGDGEVLAGDGGEDELPRDLPLRRRQRDVRRLLDDLRGP